MNVVLDVRRSPPVGLSRQLLWRYPEWWCIALSVTAWTTLIVVQLVQGADGHPAAGSHLTGWVLETFNWMLMVLAMMLPLVLHSVRLTAARSLWRRRHRAIGGFLIGYLAPWVGAGACLAAIDVALGLERWLHGLPWLGGVGFAVAAVWQLAPVKRRALLACHRTIPIAPSGWQADRDCLRFGWLTGGHCLINCWALMLACVLAGHHLTAMVCSVGMGLADRYWIRPNQRATFGPLLGIAFVYAILGFSALQSV